MEKSFLKLNLRSFVNIMNKEHDVYWLWEYKLFVSMKLAIWVMKIN